MRTGFAVPVSGAWATPANMTEVARGAEELGYHSLWTFQRLLLAEGSQAGPMYRSVQDPVVTLSYLAGRTSGIRLGVAVLNMPFYSPALLAKQLATLQAVSGGRLDAGLGLGWQAEEFTASGVPMERRGRRAEEFLQVLRTLWTQEVAEHHGEFYELPRVRQEPRPEPPPAILLGGAAEPALRRAGRLADGWISASRTDLTRIGEQIYIVKEAASQAGRDPESLRFVCRGVTKVRKAPGAPLTGPYDKIREDVAALAAQGVTEVFHDLNFDPEIGSVNSDPVEALRRAREAMEALAP